jgi:SAM-dependent methyltransferase
MRIDPAGSVGREGRQSPYEGIHLVPTFAAAENWKRYFARFVGKYVYGDVLEVGAADGATTPYVYSSRVRSWLCLDADPELSQRAEHRFKGDPSRAVTVRTGTLQDLSPDDLFDTVLYLDVLEHISDDGAEVRRALDHIRASGHLVVLAPAHDFLFTSFDEAVGHKRRYSLQRLIGVADDRAQLVEGRYLDSAGMLASLANRYWLRSATPTAVQVALWDRVLTRVSVALDPLLAYRVGKSVLVVWRRG